MIQWLSYYWDESYASDTPADLHTLLWLSNDTTAKPPDLPPVRIYRNQPMAFCARVAIPAIR